MFRLLNVSGRAALEANGLWFDLAELAADDHLADPMQAIERFTELHELARRCDPARAHGEVRGARIEAAIPRPTQVFAIGLNYAEHAAESALDLPPAPLTFTKFPSSIADPTADIPLSGAMVDWEVEIVAVIGKSCSYVSVDSAWDAIAGLTLGQDISDRHVQLSGTPPQFSLGKSFSGYSPIGPAVVSLDSFADRDDIAFSCEVSGEKMQSGRTGHMIFSIPRLVAYLSSICTLMPGDLIFTGTPDGVGMARNRFLVPGDVVSSRAEGIGELTNRCVPGRGPVTP